VTVIIERDIYIYIPRYSKVALTEIARSKIIRLIATMDKTTLSDVPVRSLKEQVLAWEKRVTEVRSNGDPEATVAIAIAAENFIEQQINKQTDWTEDERAALKTVKRFTYNAAADAWPGWELDGPSPNTQLQTTARGLAQRSTDWSKKLQLGAIQEGTGIWLVGAFDLALGDFDGALAHFTTASQQYQAASAPALSLLVEGYEVIAKGLRIQQPQGNIMRDLEKVFTQIYSVDFKDGAMFIEQLRTALKVFSKEYVEGYHTCTEDGGA
jgi:hypothetical protein